jgi:hypothetical protein
MSNSYTVMYLLVHIQEFYITYIYGYLQFWSCRVLIQKISYVDSKPGKVYKVSLRIHYHHQFISILKSWDSPFIDVSC